MSGSAAMGVNCIRWIHFGSEGGAIVMVTDIVNPATYVLKGNTVALTFGPGSEFGAGTYTLTVHDDTGELEWNDFPAWPRWKLKPAR